MERESTFTNELPVAEWGDKVKESRKGRKKERKKRKAEGKKKEERKEREGSKGRRERGRDTDSNWPHCVRQSSGPITSFADLGNQLMNLNNPGDGMAF